MDVYLLREWYIVTCVLLYQMTSGFIMALPGVITPTITGNKTDPYIHATREQASWFTASYGAAGPIGFVILPAVMQGCGRRSTFLLINLLLCASSVVTALATDVKTLIVGRLISGLDFAGVIICAFIVAEYSHPRRRGSFILLKTTAASVGHLLCHGLGFKLPWRLLAWFSTVPVLLAILGTAKWPESPPWFAYKGRYEDCAKSFEYLRGTGKEASKELEELLFSQRELKKRGSDYGTSFNQTLRAFRSKTFWKPLLVGSVLIALLQTSGGYFLIAFLIEIMIKLSGDRSKAYYFSIGSDVVEIFFSSLMFLFINKVNRRLMLFIVTSISFSLIGSACIFNYLNTKGVLHCIWLAPFLILLFNGFRRCLLSILITIKSEIFPLQYRGLCNTITGIIVSLLGTLYLKTTSSMLQLFDVYGTFAIYTALCIVLLLSLYFILPETKDRTLQNIDNDFVGLKLQSKKFNGEQHVENDLFDLAMKTTEFVAKKE